MAAKFIFTNSRGQSIEFKNSAPIFLQTYHGTGGSPVDIQTQKSPYQDGETLIDTLLEMRLITLEVVLLGDDVIQHRRRLMQVLNPKLGAGVLRLESGTGAYEIKAQPNGAPLFPGGKARKPGYQECLVEFLAPDPFWLDDYAESKEIVTWIGGMTFPWVLPSSFATKGPRVINIINQGDVETPVRIEFKGPATNPRVSNRATGEYIQVNRELVLGDVLVITTDFGAKRVEINDQNVFNWIDLESTFWQLQVGDNIIEYSSDDPVEPAAVTISYRNRYVGV